MIIGKQQLQNATCHEDQVEDVVTENIRGRDYGVLREFLNEVPTVQPRY